MFRCGHHRGLLLCVRPIINIFGEVDNSESVPEINICIEHVHKDEVTYEEGIGRGSYFPNILYNNVKPEIVSTFPEDINGKNSITFVPQGRTGMMQQITDATLSQEH